PGYVCLPPTRPDGSWSSRLRGRSPGHAAVEARTATRTRDRTSFDVGVRAGRFRASNVGERAGCGWVRLLDPGGVLLDRGHDVPHPRRHPRDSDEGGALPEWDSHRVDLQPTETGAGRSGS